MADKPAHPLYASEQTRTTYGPMLDRLPEMAGFNANSPALVVMTQGDLRRYHAQLPSEQQVANMTSSQLATTYGGGAQRVLTDIGVPAGLVSPGTLNDSLPWLVTGNPGSTLARSGSVCLLVLPEKPGEFRQLYPDHRWLADVTSPAANQVLNAPDPGFVPVHETRHCVQDIRLSETRSELDADGQATRHFPQVGAVNERIRMISGVLDAAFRHIDGHETSFIQTSPDPAQAEKDSVRVHHRLVGLVGADVAMQQNKRPDALLAAIQDVSKRNPPQGEDLERMQRIEMMLQAGMDVRSVREDLDKLSPAFGGEVKERFGRMIAPDVLKDDPRQFAEALHSLHHRGGLENTGLDAAANQSVQRLGGLYLNSVADLHPEASHLRVQVTSGSPMSEMPVESGKPPSMNGAPVQPQRATVSAGSGASI